MDNLTPSLVILRPIAGLEYQCPQCNGRTQVPGFTPCVTCPNCGLVSDARMESDTLSCLTERECHILTMIGQGFTNGEIAVSLSIQPGTARNHVSDIYAKLGLSNRAEAATLITSITRGAKK